MTYNWASTGIFPDWSRGVGNRASLHHGQMRNDVVLDAVLDRESPIFRNNKIVPVNGISGTVTFPLWRNDVSFSTLLILTV